MNLQENIHRIQEVMGVINLDKFVIKWLNNKYGDLIPIETEKYPDSIFYRKGDEVIFEYDKENRKVYINYGEIWSFLESMFSMEYKQIRDLTKEWVEESYKLRVTTTELIVSSCCIRWRNITN